MGLVSGLLAWHLLASRVVLLLGICCSFPFAGAFSTDVMGLFRAGAERRLNRWVKVFSGGYVPQAEKRMLQATMVTRPLLHLGPRWGWHSRLLLCSGMACENTRRKHRAVLVV